MRADRWTSVRTLLPSAWASLALLHSCAQVVPADASDAGPAQPPSITEVDPKPGPVEARASFRVAFSAPMDLSLLLVAPGRSDSVVLVPQADVDLVAAALSHGRLTAAQRELLVPVQAQASADAAELTLRPDDPLAPGSYFLLVSSRLKDAQGKRMKGNGARFEFTVATPPPRAQLDAPAPGWSSPTNLRRVRLSFPDGASADAISIVRRDGGVVAGPAVSDGGALILNLRPDLAEAGCAPLCPGGEYLVQQGGVELDAAGFRAAACARSQAPQWVSRGPAISPGDDWAEVSVVLDWPALVHLQAQANQGGPAVETTVLVGCAPDWCGADGGRGEPGACARVTRLEGLAPSTSYVLRAWSEDDEGNRTEPIQKSFTTTAPLPHARIDEVMASPPLPAPRSDGEYVEILNTGTEPLDTARLALAREDDRARPLVGRASAAPSLGAGQRALAVGSAFDESRYSIPAGVPILRADTKRLLGHGVADDPPVIRLLWMDQDGGSGAELDRYPGNGPQCQLGESLERGAADGGPPAFHCGADGGSPGRPPGPTARGQPVAR